MKFEDYGDDKYKFPEVYLFQKTINNILISSTTEQDVAIENNKEKEDYGKMALDTCRKSPLNIEEILLR